MTEVVVQKSVMQANDELAASLRERWQSNRTTVLNLVSSPGSGKTTLLERTLGALKNEFSIGVLVGDVQTDNDARRLLGYGCAVLQIVTNGTCHLDAAMVAKHSRALGDESLDLLIIENVGNLVCPASYDLGEDSKVVLLSVTEGEDKPLKYPAMFRRADAALLTKSDLLPYVDSDVTLIRDNLSQIHSGIPLLQVSSKTGEGLDAWYEWIRQRVEQKKASSPVGQE